MCLSCMQIYSDHQRAPESCTLGDPHLQLRHINEQRLAAVRLEANAKRMDGPEKRKHSSRSSCLHQQTFRNRTLVSAGLFNNRAADSVKAAGGNDACSLAPQDQQIGKQMLMVLSFLNGADVGPWWRNGLGS